MGKGFMGKGLSIKALIGLQCVVLRIFISTENAGAASLSPEVRFPLDCPGLDSTLLNSCVATPGPLSTNARFRRDNLAGWIDLTHREANPFGFLIGCRYVQGPTDKNLLSTWKMNATQWEDVDQKNMTIDTFAYRKTALSLDPLSYALADPRSPYLKWVLSEIKKAGNNTSIPAARQYLKNLDFFQTALQRLLDRCAPESGGSHAAGFPDFCRWDNGRTMKIKKPSGTAHWVRNSSHDTNLNRFILSALLSAVHRIQRLENPAVTNHWGAVSKQVTGTVRSSKPVLLKAVRAQIGIYKESLYGKTVTTCTPENDVAAPSPLWCDMGANGGHYANMDLEYVVIMDYARLLFGNSDPSTPRGFSGESQAMMQALSKQLISKPGRGGGAFHYIANSTESPVYHTMVVGLLAEHYDLAGPGSGPSSIRDLLSSGLTYYGNTYTSEGQPEGWSDIYTKQQWYPPSVPGIIGLLGAPMLDEISSSENIWRERTEHVFWQILGSRVRPCELTNPNWTPVFEGHGEVQILNAWDRYAKKNPWIGSRIPALKPSSPGRDLETHILRWDPDIQGFHGRAPIGGLDSSGKPLVWNFGYVHGPGGRRNTFVGGAMTSSDSARTAFPVGTVSDPATAFLRGVEFEVLKNDTNPSVNSLLLRHGYWLSDDKGTNAMAWRRAGPASNPSTYQNIEAALLGVSYFIQPAGRLQFSEPVQETPFRATQVWRVAGGGMIGLLHLDVIKRATSVKGVISRILMGPNEVVKVAPRIYRSGPLAVKILGLRNFSDVNVLPAAVPGGVEFGYGVAQGKMGLQILQRLSDYQLSPEDSGFEVAIWIGPYSRLDDAPDVVEPLHWREADSLGGTIAGWRAKWLAKSGAVVAQTIALSNPKTPVQDQKARSLVLNPWPDRAHLSCNLGTKDVSNSSMCFTTPTGVVTLNPGVGALIESANVSPW